MEKLSNRKGFTLIEVLIAIALLAIGVAVLFTMQTFSANQITYNKSATVATELAQKKVEELKGTPYSTIFNGNTQEKGMTVSWTVAPNTVNVTETNGSTSSYNYKDITVTVTWGTKRVALHTIISEG